jgi:predicted nicotinamide N-methyase
MDVFRFIGGSDSDDDDDDVSDDDEDEKVGEIEYSVLFEKDEEEDNDDVFDMKEALRVVRSRCSNKYDVWMKIWKNICDRKKQKQTHVVDIFDACINSISTSLDEEQNQLVGHILYSLVSIDEDVRQELRCCDRESELEKYLSVSSSPKMRTILFRVANILISSPERLENLRNKVEFSNYETQRPDQMIPLRKFQFADDIVVNITQRGVILGVVKSGEEPWRAVARATGHVAWASGIALCRYLASNRDLIKNKRILDLGSGTGLVGLLCARINALHVTLTDLPEVLDHLKENTELNSFKSSVVDIKALQWGTISTNSEKYHCDVVLAAGVVVHESQFVPLCETIYNLLLQGAKYMLLSYQQRRSLVECTFFELLSSSRFGLRCDCVTTILESGKSVKIFKIYPATPSHRRVDSC